MKPEKSIPGLGLSLEEGMAQLHSAFL